MWSLVGVNLAAAGCMVTLAAWMCLCFCALQLFKMYTFGRGYAQGLSFLQRLKSWNLINWGQRLKLVNSVLAALFLLQTAPAGGLGALAWGALAGLLALAGAADLAGDLLGGVGVDAEDEIADGRQHQNPDAAARHGAAAHAAPVFDAAAAPSALPTHDVVSALNPRPKLGENAGAGEGMQL